MYHKSKKYLEDRVKSVFPNFIACYLALYQPCRELLSPEPSNSLLQLGIYFSRWKSCFETFGRNFDLFWRRALDANFEVFMLLRVMFMVFFGEIFLICRFQRSFVYDVAGGTKFWPVLLIVVHGFLGKEFYFSDFHFMFFLHLVQFTLQL